MACLPPGAYAPMEMTKPVVTCVAAALLAGLCSCKKVEKLTERGDAHRTTTPAEQDMLNGPAGAASAARTPATGGNMKDTHGL